MGFRFESSDTNHGMGLVRETRTHGMGLVRETQTMVTNHAVSQNICANLLKSAGEKKPADYADKRRLNKKLRMYCLIKNSCSGITYLNEHLD